MLTWDYTANIEVVLIKFAMISVTFTLTCDKCGDWQWAIPTCATLARMCILSSRTCGNVTGDKRRARRQCF